MARTKDQGDSDRLVSRLAELSGREMRDAAGTRILPARLKDLLREIDATVLPRRLALIGTSGTFTLDVANRRLVQSAAAPDQSLTEADAEELAALKDALVVFLGDDARVSVSATPLENHDPSDVGASVGQIAEAWEIALYPGASRDPEAAMAALIERIGEPPAGLHLRNGEEVARFGGAEVLDQVVETLAEPDNLSLTVFRVEEDDADTLAVIQLGSDSLILLISCEDLEAVRSAFAEIVL